MKTPNVPGQTVLEDALGEEGGNPAVAGQAAWLATGVDSHDTLSMYLRDVRRTELFTPTEEFDMATRARAGRTPTTRRPT